MEKNILKRVNRLKMSLHIRTVYAITIMEN